MRASRTEMQRFILDFSATVGRAEAGIKGLKTAARSSGDDLEKLIERAHGLRDELHFLIERGPDRQQADDHGHLCRAYLWRQRSAGGKETNRTPNRKITHDSLCHRNADNSIRSRAGVVACFIKAGIAHEENASPSPRMFLALTIFVGVLIMGVRAGDVWDSVTKGPAFKAVKEVQAEEKQPAPKAEDKTPKSEAPIKSPSMQAEALDKDSDLYRQMVGRREQLDKREGEIDTREAMVKIAEKRIDQKIKELETLRQQVQTLLGCLRGAGHAN